MPLVYTESERATAVLGSATTPTPALVSGRWLNLGLRALIQSGYGRWGHECRRLDRQTPRAPRGVKGNHHETNRLCTVNRCWQNGGRSRDEGCDQKSHCAILPILHRQAVTLDAPTDASAELSPGAWSALGVRHAAVGQNNGIVNGLDLLGAIAFAHVFELNRRPYRCCFRLCIFVAKESEFHG